MTPDRLLVPVEKPDPTLIEDPKLREWEEQLIGWLTFRLDSLERGYLRYRRLTLRILTGLCIGLLIYGVLGTVLLVQNGNQTDDIQDSRIRATVSSCLEQNARNRATVMEYDRRIKAAVDSGQVTGAQLKRLKQSREFTVGLIDQLAPSRDCVARARHLLGSGAVPEARRMVAASRG